MNATTHKKETEMKSKTARKRCPVCGRMIASYLWQAHTLNCEVGCPPVDLRVTLINDAEFLAKVIETKSKLERKQAILDKLTDILAH